VSHASGEGGARPRFDRHLVLDQLGGWRGMVDASLPTVAFIVANSIGGLWPGIWAALACALLVFVLRLVRRQSIQQAVSGLFAVGVAVAIAAVSGHARDFFVLGILRNAAIAVVLVGSTLVRCRWSGSSPSSSRPATSATWPATGCPACCAAAAPWRTRWRTTARRSRPGRSGDPVSPTRSPSCTGATTAGCAAPTPG
jgi:hypothetical protein